MLRNAVKHATDFGWREQARGTTAEKDTGQWPVRNSRRFQCKILR